MNWSMFTPVPLNTALDNASLTFMTGGSANWVGVSDESYYGGSSARSGAILHSQSTWMQTTVTGAGTFSFWYKVSSESTWDKLIFYADGVQKSTASGTGSVWQQFKCVVSNDTQHVFKWTYSKDGSGSIGSDCCWIDKVEWVPSVWTANVVVDAAKGTVEVTDGSYVVTAAEGATLTADDIVFGAVAKEAYTVTIAADGKSATVTLNAPAFGAAAGLDEGEAQKDEADPSGALVAVAKDKIAAKPTDDAAVLGALPVKTYEGLTYQAAWGDDIGNLTPGEKVDGTGGTIYLGVIKQTGAKGFYKVTVSEK